MTIFIKAAKLLMLHCLDHSMDEASSKNLGWLGGFRNADLSGDQKTLTLKLRKLIEDFTLQETDEKNLATLKSYIATIDKEVEEIRKKKYKYSRGNLNETLTKMNSDLERFYNTISKFSFKLSDTVDDTDPFHILCAHATYYFGENIFIPTEEGVLVKTVTSVVGSSAVDVRAQKEECLLKHLQECDKKLRALKEGSEFDDLRKELVVEEIQAIQRENAQICKNAQPISSIPVSVSMFATANIPAPTLKPSRGRLEICMKNTLEAIASLTKSATESLGV